MTDQSRPMPAGDVFAALEAVELRPLPAGGVMAVCLRHGPDHVHAMLINSAEAPPTLGGLAYMAGEHLAEEHAGPPLCVCPTVARAEDAEDTRRIAVDACPVHGRIARALEGEAVRDAAIRKVLDLVDGWDGTDAGGILAKVRQAVARVPRDER